MTPRELLQTRLAATIPAEYRMLPYPRAFDAPRPGGVLVMLAVEGVAPPSGENPYRTYTFGVLVTVAETQAGTADDALDEALEEVLYGLDQGGLPWTGCERVVLEEPALPAYRITVPIPISATEPDAQEG